MTLPLITFVLLLLFQLLLNLYANITKRNLIKQFRFPLLSQTEPAVTLELYNKIFRSVNIKVNATIPTPAFALKDFVLINKNYMYSADLFTNYYLIYHLELSRKEHTFIRTLKWYFGLLFLIQIALASYGWFLAKDAQVFIYAALGLQIILILFSFVFKSSLNSIHSTVSYLAYDLLNLTTDEQILAKKLGKELRAYTFEYPLFIIKKLINFFIPRT